jgi:hypothetical protein
MHDTYQQPSPAQRRAVTAALLFVYPDIRIPRRAQYTPDLAALVFMLARALDSTSRITYGLFSFYEGLLGGMAARTLTWKSIPEALAGAVKGAVEDSQPQRNALASAFVRMRYPQRLVERHMDDPDTHPLPVITIDKNSRLDRWVFQVGD